MTTNLLDLPLKRTENISIRQPLGDTITSQFKQHVEDFHTDLNRIDAERSAIVECSISLQGLEAYKLYYTQLCYLITKLPIDIGANFAWYNLDSPIKHEADDLSFEKANVLYNIALLYAGLGVRENRSTANGLKKAHQHFQMAAGCFQLLEQHMQTVYFHVPEDLSKEYLVCLKSVMLAQAQECIWQRAVLDQMKDKLIAQLAEQVSKSYREATQALERSNAMTSSWMHHLRVKQFHFAAAAQVRMSATAMSANKYGEEVARLRLALNHCDSAQPHSLYVGKAVAQDLKGLMSHIQNTLSRAEKDNDMIYLEPVPSASSLAGIVPQLMVKATILPELEGPLAHVADDDLLFRNLIPIVVYNMRDIFEQRKADIVSKEIINKLHALDLEMHARLQDLGLPGSLTVIEQPLGLPRALLSQSDEVKERGGSQYLKGLLDEVTALALANSELIDQIVDMMDEASMEDVEDAALTGYRHQIDQYHTFLTQAKTSDDLVRTKVEQWTPHIDLLASDNDTLSRAIPDSQRITLSQERESRARRVRILLNSWDLLYSDRKAHIELLRNDAEHDDIAPALTRFAASFASHMIPAESFEPLLAARLARYQGETAYIADSGARQKSLMSDLNDANAAFLACSDDTPSPSTRDRECVLQDLSTAHHKYREIINNLEEGAKFYNDFHRALCRVSDDVSVCITRQRDLIRDTQRLSVADTVVVGQAPVAGTWNQSHGISFRKSQPDVSVPRSNTAETKRQSHVYDPAKHAIKFASS